MMKMWLIRRMVLVAVAGLAAMPALASETCEATFRSDFNKERDSMFFGASRLMPGLKMRTVLPQLQTIARQQGFEVESPEYTNGYGDLTFRQKPGANSRGFVLVARASEEHGQVGIATEMPSGMKAKPEDVRKILCGMLAQVKAPAVPREVAAARPSPKPGARVAAAKPAGRELPRGDLPMGDLPVGECPPGGCKIKWHPAFTGDIRDERDEEGRPIPKRPADTRTAPPAAEDRLRPVSPRTPFNLGEARAALAEGTATISGTACVARGGNIYQASNEPIYLYPATPYMRELVEVMRKAKPGRDRVVLADGVLSARLEGRTNDYGGFRFARLKPGRYYLYATMKTVTLESRDVVVGSYTNSMGYSGDITAKEGFTQGHDDVLEKFVDVTNDGQTVKVTLSPRFSLRGGYAGVVGCD